MPVNLPPKKLPAYPDDATVLMKGRELNDITKVIEQNRPIGGPGVNARPTGDGVVLSVPAGRRPAFLVELEGTSFRIEPGTTAVMDAEGTFDPIVTEYDGDPLTDSPPPLVPSSSGSHVLWIRFSLTTSEIVSAVEGTPPTPAADEYLIPFFSYVRTGDIIAPAQLRTGDIEIGGEGGLHPFQMHSPRLDGGSWKVQVAPGWVYSDNPANLTSTPEYTMPVIVATPLNNDPAPEIIVADGQVVVAKIERDKMGVIVPPILIEAVSEATADASKHYYPDDFEGTNGEDEQYQYRKLFKVSIPVDENPVTSAVYQTSGIELKPILWSFDHIGSGPGKILKKFDKTAGLYQFHTIAPGPSGRDEATIDTVGDQVRVYGNGINGEITLNDDSVITTLIQSVDGYVKVIQDIEIEVVELEVCLTGGTGTVTKKFLAIP